MWLHVPSTLLACAVGSKDSDLDSNRLSLLERFCTWKSKHQSRQFWRLVWKKDSSIKHLSGLTLSHSTLSRSVAKWTSSLDRRPVPPSPLPVKNLPKAMQETSGPTSPDSLGSLGFQLGFSWKTSQDPSSSDTTSLTLEKNYERWVIQLRKDYFQRQKQELPKNDREFLYWHTEDEGINTWPTPMTRDWKGMDGPGKKNALKPPELYLSIPQVQRTEKNGKNYSEDSPKSNQPFAKKIICSTKCRRINPNFHELLQGLPVGWTIVSDCEPLVTQLYRQWQHALLSYLRRN